MNNTEKRDKIVKGIRKKLEKSGWGQYLWKYWVSAEWERIVDFLVQETDNERRWMPGADIMFRWMQECPVKKIKVVMLVDRVPIIWGTNDGIPLSQKDKKVADKSIVSMQETIPGYSDHPIPVTDMTYWANQGVLMIPTALTAEIGREGHYKLWEPFVHYMIDTLNRDYSELPWVLMGKRAIDYSASINTERKIPLRFHHWEEWRPMWDQINSWIILNDEIPIEWSK